MIDYHKLRNWQFADVEHTYRIEDTIHYALALGLGHDPTNEQELQFVNDYAEGQPVALPTMSVVLGFPGSWMADPETGIDFPKILHGEEQIVVHHPLPSAGTVIAKHRVTRVVDKGPGRGATITYDKDLYDKESGQHLVTVTHTTFARGDGGFSSTNGLTDPSLPSPAPMPQRAPDQRVEIATLPQLALMYRLCADRNPLHSTPSVARAAGFERPILHGLCTYGIAGYAVLAQCCGHDPRRLKSLSARFTAPVLPGDKLTVELFNEGGAVLFRVRVAARDKTVLDCGRAEIAF
ncbi:MaoC/PaaZ C-terminal domain-containing protein [Ralstonia insidiosa]|uniref:3-alpha,7-alpha, 12-alpha-trihydroxy-5-beta-cholest-24-enoyl-CoA hydratase n=1 Tax=Ralstonia insidiosa TaxID=190721 RepID=A0A848P095_9RALS|nr:MaoC/PaaZ C-terminal domain-containing protein [Ralstonia insidiosa]NMV38106.1 3-alpha,7-alpha,12-alpha-trihydroxy-5-beta-cholest-24-enoyl-CoA hydratase [Ralstonia insidiosa]